MTGGENTSAGISTGARGEREMRTRKGKRGKPKGRGEKPKWGDKTQGVEKEKRAVDRGKAKSWNKTRKGATPKGAGKTQKD